MLISFSPASVANVGSKGDLDGYNLGTETCIDCEECVTKCDGILDNISGVEVDFEIC